MKKRIFRILAFATIAAICWLDSMSACAADKETSAAGEWKTQLVSLRIDKPVPGMNMARMGGHPGTSLAIWIADPENRLVAFDQNNSKLEKFEDDKGTDLTELMPGPFNWSRFGVFRGGRFSTKGFQVEVGGDSFPAPGAAKISLKATLVFRRAASEKTIEEKDVPVKTGRKIKAGTLQLNIEAVSEEKMKENQQQNQGFRGPDFPETKMGISLVASASMENIKSVLFFNSKGEEIKITMTSSGSQSTGLLGTTYTNDYWLAEKLDEVTVKITYYEGIESVKIPLNMETGVGF
jgi:hypothetical protein